MSSTAWPFLVVSSEGQAETLQHQRAWAETTSAEKGWVLERVGDFEDVSTGKRGVRRLLTSLITELRSLKPEARPAWVMMIRADRVGRGRIDASLLAQHEILELGVRIWTRDDGEVRLDSAMAQMIAAFKAGLAAMENEVRSDKASHVYKRKRAAGQHVGNRSPYGLLIGPDKRWAADPERADYVRQAFAWRIAGEGMTTIGKRLQANSPPARRAKGPDKPMDWMEYSVARMLKNRAYIGPVVDEVTFQRAQLVPGRLVSRTWDVSPVYPWPLTGAIRCVCGGALAGQAGGHAAPGRRWRYYRCFRKNRHLGEKRPSFRADALEAQFFELLKRFEVDPEAFHRAAPAVSPQLIDRALAALDEDLIEIAGQRDAVWEMSAAGTVRKEDVQERLDALAGRRDAMKARKTELLRQRAVALASLHEGELGSELLARAIALWPVAAARDQRSLAREIALKVGGLWVDETGTLRIGLPVISREEGARLSAHSD